MKRHKATLSPQLVQAAEQRLGLRLQLGLETRLIECVHDLIARSVVHNEGEIIARLLHARHADPVVQAIQQASTIGETYFFRGLVQLQRLERMIEKHLVEPKRERGQTRLRLWSAACSTGEEAYTLAIIVKQLAPDFAVTVVGSDMNEGSLQIAREGVYQSRSFRQLRAELINDWFLPHPQGRVVNDELKACVSFVQHNLVTDHTANPQLHRFDVMVCRNVLIYLRTDDIPSVMARLCKRGNPTSLLVLTPAEYAAARYAPNYEDASTGILIRKPAVAAPTSLKANRPFSSSASGRHGGLHPKAKTHASGSEKSKMITPHQAETETDLKFARQAADSGDFALAQQTLAAILKLEPDSALARYLLAEIALAQGDAPTATREFRRALFLKRALIAAELGLGLALVQLDKKAEAVRHLTRTLELLKPLTEDTVLEGLEQTTLVARGLTNHALATLREEA